MSDQHARFQERVRMSSRAVFIYAEHQHVLGHRVEIAPMRIAPRAADAPMYSDDGDMFVTDDDGLRHRVEVKGLSYEFARLPVIFVDGKDRLEHIASKVSFFVYLNRARTHCAVLAPETRRYWYLTKTLNRNTGNYERVYACPKHLAKYIQLLRIEDQRCSSASIAAK